MKFTGAINAKLCDGICGQGAQSAFISSEATIDFVLVTWIKPFFEISEKLLQRKLP